jgi:sulfite reductase (NADPH) flavoprotein alpha-component
MKQWMLALLMGAVISAQSADTIILVGSEGNSTWGFAGTLHAALTQAGHRVHTAPMNRLAPAYAHAARMLILTATYGDGAAPASATRFLARLDTVKNPLPVAVLGFGDRSFPHFCRFAEDVADALRDRGWPVLSKLAFIDRQSPQDFARWGTDLGGAIGTELKLTHIAARPKTIALELIERVDYGAEVQAPTVILRFAAPKANLNANFWRRLRAPRLPEFEPGDLVGILPPGSDLPRFYSLASSNRDGVGEVTRSGSALASMIEPGVTASPPYRFTPRYWGLESRPLRVEPPPFLCAMSRPYAWMPVISTRV